MKSGAAAVFIAEEALFGKDTTGLSNWIEQQEPWSDLPFVILTSRQEPLQVSVWRERLVATLRNVAMLERPIQAITLTSTIRAAVRARGRQYEVRTLLEAREQTARNLEALVAARTEELEQANQELRLQMAERARMEETIRQAQKIEAIGQLTGGIAHDFNNLLMVMSGGLDMLSRNPEPKRQQMLFEGMRQAAQRGAGLTRQLLAFSRRQALHPEAIDLSRQINRMRELLDRSLRGDVHVDLELPEGLWPTHADAGELEFALLNLAVNARDAMPDGGTIIIRGENAPATETGLGEDFVTLSIIDAGTGMTEEVKTRVFEPFFTTKGVGRGSGLGLAQVHGFAAQSGGKVEIDTAIGRGTTVTLYLPRSTQTPLVSFDRLDEDSAKSNTEPKTGQILLVEDDDEVASLVREMLDELGYEVLRVASASAALGALGNGRDVDLVFSDIMMPGGMDGMQLAREIRTRKPHMPILLTSGFAAAFQSLADAENIRLLPKPYRLNELALAVDELRPPPKSSSPH
jgi:signal transduction histidine kinase/CheY-like chemotaxis protein